MEFVTALRGTFDDQKPSLFEILSEQQLSALLPPTLRYLLTVATQRYPRHLLRALNSFDELHALLMLLVERHYLRTRGGSFTEHFYGLKRERAVEVPRATALAAGLVRESLALDVWPSLAVLVGVPYLRRKLDESWQVEAPRALLGAAYTRMPAAPTWRQRLLHYYRWFVRNVYPSLHAAYAFAVLAFNLAYLFDRTPYHSPLMWLIGTRVRRMNGADYRAIEEQLAKPAATSVPRAGNPPAAAALSLLSPRSVGPRLLNGLSVLLPTSIFALKFLEWWYASDFAKQLSRKASENLELPPPVVSGLASLGLKIPPRRRAKDSDKSEENEQTGHGREEELSAEDAPIATPSLLPIYTVPAPTEHPERCPICEDEIATPTACQTGFVYCYSCIHRWVEGSHPMQEAFMTGREGKWESGRGRCAVTGRRVLGGTEGLRRIIV